MVLYVGSSESRSFDNSRNSLTEIALLIRLTSEYSRPSTFNSVNEISRIATKDENSVPPVQMQDDWWTAHEHKHDSTKQQGSLSECLLLFSSETFAEDCAGTAEAEAVGSRGGSTLGSA